MASASYTNPVTPNATVTLALPATKRRVTYVFDTKATKASLSIPYAVAIDDNVSSEYDQKPKRVSGNHGAILVEAAPGERVKLYLNSDAHPAHRKRPVYAVTVGEHHIDVKVTEKTGKHADSDTPTNPTVSAEKSLDTYKVPLTGDIWMKVSHAYSPDEVDALVPADTALEVKAAVKRIYQPLTENKLTISIPATPTKAAVKLVVTFSDSDNPKNNIVSYDLLKDGLPRVHPGGYAALFSAALLAGVPTMTMSSAWRPCLGSIAHRAGLGLDVSLLGNVKMNRQELRSSSAVDTDNVSDEEKQRFKAFEKEKDKETAARKDEKAKQKSVAQAKKTADKDRKAADKAKKKFEGVKNDPAKGLPAKAAWDAAEATSAASAKQRDEAQSAHEDAKETLQKATERRTKAEKAWCEERDKNQPESVAKFRAALAASAATAQLFDPWFMDANTRDGVAAQSNLQVDDNETLHSHHLHLTVFEPKIL